MRVSGGIEPEGFDSSRPLGLSAREAFHLSANPIEVIRRDSESQWGTVLQQIEQHQRELEAQRTSAQAEWGRGRGETEIRQHRLRLRTDRSGSLTPSIIGAGSTWLFDRSTSTFSTGSRRPAVPVLTSVRRASA